MQKSAPQGRIFYGRIEWLEDSIIICGVRLRRGPARGKPVAGPQTALVLILDWL